MIVIDCCFNNRLNGFQDAAGIVFSQEVEVFSGLLGIGKAEFFLRICRSDDAVGVLNNSAGFLLHILTEYTGQGHNRKNLYINHIPQHEAGAYAWELVVIAQDDNAGF